MPKFAQWILFTALRNSSLSEGFMDPRASILFEALFLYIFSEPDLILDYRGLARSA